MGLIVGNRGFFPAHLANSGREEMTDVLQQAGMDVVVLDAGGIQVRRSDHTRRCSALRRTLQEQSRPDRRNHSDAAELRRRAGHRRHAETGESAGAGAGAGDARRCEEDDHRLPPRQLLRQDVSLQQPEAVRYSILDHVASHGGTRLAGVCQGPGVVCCRLSCGQWVEEPAHWLDWRASYGVQHRSLQRKTSGVAGHFGRDARSVGGTGAHRAHEGQR